MSLWPLAVYGATAGALVFGARRLCPALDRREALWLVLAPLLFVGPALWTGRTLSPIDRAYNTEPLKSHRELLAGRAPTAAIFHDPFHQILPWRAAVRYAYRQGEWPLWNPFQRAGEPLAGLGQAAPYAPLNLVALAVELADEAALVGGLTLCVAGLGAFVLFAHFGLAPSAARIGALVWAASANLLFWLQWPLAQTVALLPFVLFAASRLARSRRLGDAALLAGALVALLLTGHQESVLHVSAFAAIWAAAELPWRSPERVARALALALGAGALAAALAAFFLLPHLDAIEQSHQYRSRTDANHAFQAADLGATLDELRAELVPFVEGVENGEAGPRRRTSISPTRAFAGGLALALAAAGLVGGRRRLAAAGVACALFGALAGAGFRPIHELLARLPLFDIALNARLQFLGSFGLALLAALGVDSWHRIAPDGRRSLLRAAAAAALLLALAAALFWPSARQSGLDGAIYARRSAWLVAPAVLGIAAVARRRPSALALALVAALHLAERRAESAFLFRPQERAAFFPRVAPLDALPAEDAPYRVAALHYALVPNMATYYGLEDPRGENALTQQRLVEFLNAFQPARIDWDVMRERVRDLADRRLELLNVRYVLAQPGKRVPPWYRAVARTEGLNLFLNRRALPRAFLPRNVLVGAPGVSWAERAAHIERYAELATIEPLAALATSSAAEPVRNARGRLTTRRAGLGYSIRAQLDEPGWIVVSTSHWRGWRAVAGGAELPLGYADHAYLGVLAPAGESEIELRYRPASFVVGARISAIALLAALTGGIALAVRGRNDRVPAAAG